MKAREMFKELGFELKEDSYAKIEYETKVTHATKRTITFWEKYKMFHNELYQYNYNSELVVVGSCAIDKTLYKAITQQLKELGWLDE